MEYLEKIDFRDRKLIISLVAVPTLTLLAARTLRNLARKASFREPAIFSSPPKSTDSLTENDNASAYPPDALEGARDVDTPYGSVRVYEWGPLDGKKVLFIHGISTPCIALGQMAEQLVEEAGCRVMLFDLFGRGYSDTPDPLEFKQDIRLFTSQILLVLASSPIAWTGEDNGFTLVGYSLGGGIGATFTSYFPHLVDSLVLIAPAGLMRASRFHWSSKLIYGGIMPDIYRNFLVRRRLVGSSPPKSAVKDESAENTPSSTAALIPHITGSAAESVVWQVQSHPGFLSAFISSIRYAPISTEHARWRLIGSRLTAQKRPRASAAAHAQGLREGKVLVIFGKTDGVVVPEETAEDAIEVLGKDNVHTELLHGGHDVPYTNATGCVDAIRSHWDGEL
ncbi:hypothetical protein AMS68_002782 [Peltaster fructicola]|uniref:AB hydrolase-1 domain-containing protein n=1 Tax=Peltaster fructicola TaxID=286661 RepID=A0A6H0XRK6_9PEZI|nr:hypothetical protein AMS68_002782 [Peltaster fructicola]